MSGGQVILATAWSCLRGRKEWKEGGSHSVNSAKHLLCALSYETCRIAMEKKC